MNIEEQFEAVVRAGLFKDRQDAVREAMSTLLAVRPQLRLEAAIELVRSGESSLLRGAEMAGLDFETFRRLLRDRGISWVSEAEDHRQMDQALDAFFAEPAS
jgi:predicted HTH domain antitoxin